MDIVEVIGKKIQKIREKKRITQDQLEAETGINAKYISAIECGKKNLTIKTLEKIAKGLGIELFELFLFSEELETENVYKEAIETLIKDADLKTLNTCLLFLRNDK